jgi:hypothetical protein
MFDSLADYSNDQWIDGLIDRKVVTGATVDLSDCLGIVRTLVASLSTALGFTTAELSPSHSCSLTVHHSHAYPKLICFLLGWGLDVVQRTVTKLSYSWGTLWVLFTLALKNPVAWYTLFLPL